MNLFTTILVYLVLIIGTVTIAQATTTDYCDEELCEPKDRPHIACGHNHVSHLHTFHLQGTFNFSQSKFVEI